MASRKRRGPEIAVPVPRKSSRITNNSDSSSKQTRIEKPSPQQNNPIVHSERSTTSSSGRPIRANRGQGGVVAQLENIGKQIEKRQPRSKHAQPTANIPNEAPANTMAPPPKEKHRRQQPVAAKLKPPGLRKEDPPLGTGAPKPTKQLSVSSSFGFRPESHAPESQTKRRPGSNTSVVRHPEPPPSYQFGSGDPATKRNHQATKPKQLVRRAQHHEVIPDSEEEVTEGGGQDNYEGDEEGGDNDECGSQFSLDTQARLEMGMDPDANEDDEEMQVDHRGLNVQGGDANDYQDAYQDSNAEYDNINEDFQGSQPGEGVLHQGGRFSPRDIDEHSPDEDERHAMNVLQSLPQHNNGTRTDRSPSPEEYSILQAHQRKNRRGRAPNLETLATAAASQCSSTPKQQWLRQAQEPDVDCNNLDESTASADEHPVARKRAPRNSRIDDDNLPKPTQISYYSGAWVDVLEAAKNEYRFHIHCIADDPFPERDAVTLQDAHNCLLEAMARHEDNPAAEPLNQGMFRLHFLTTARVCLMVFPAEEYDKHNMSILIFEDGSSYRGRMKALCSKLVPTYYSMELQPEVTFPLNQEHYYEIVGDNVKRLLHKSFFLQGGKDENVGKTRNFAHTAVLELCKLFYYRGKESLAALYPDEFESLPKKCLGLACTCVTNCLQEYRVGYLNQVNFSRANFAPVHAAIMGLIKNVEANSYHGAQLEKMLKAIGEDGRLRYRQKCSAGAAADFGVVLD